MPPPAVPPPPLPAWRAAGHGGTPAPATRPASGTTEFAPPPSRRPASGTSPRRSVAFLPVVDLDTGGVLAVEADAGDVTVIGLSATVDAVHGAARAEAPLPLLISIPVAAVIGGSATLAPLHEALRVTGRRPGEVTLVIRGGFDETDRRALLTGVDGLRAIGYLIAFGDFGASGVPLDLIADASPYVLVLSPDLITRIPHDHRRSGLVEALGATARSVGAHLVAPAVREEAQLAALRRWGVRLAQGPLLAPPGWRPAHGRPRVPLPLPEEPPAAVDLGPRVQEFLMPAVTLPEDVTAEEVVDALGTEPSITGVVLVDEYQRPRATVDRGRFLLTIATRFGHALYARKPAVRLADPPRVVPRTTPVLTAMHVAGRDDGRVYDDLVVVDEVGRCMGVVHVSDLIRYVADAGAAARPATPFTKVDSVVRPLTRAGRRPVRAGRRRCR
ncbi:hypothetical protein GCM10010106_00360 [Thermopolyspora flexuosa]|uniref:EAL domain-containing protein n=1 Tax=Thermopolyspora flexuosa TaxID=103836 RepID=UPI0019A36481|nr:EAL domain-containing protein [Thermopolyspora flexuosa]GGM58588.1 hypothetical protein GCM10010106_00360 [Thermopolyspora flexuosa]